MRRLADYESILHPLIRVLAHRTNFRCRPSLREILARHPRLIIAISHSTPLSWLPAISLLAVHTNARDGGDRVPIGVMDRFFFGVPFLKEVAQFITQTQRPLSFFEIADQFERGAMLDLVVFPEGSNCFFGDPHEIREFRSPKFMELAIRAEVPVLICVHRGSENWATQVPANDLVLESLDLLPRFVFDFLDRRIRQTGALALPLLPKAMEEFDMICELHHPMHKFEELSKDPVQRAAEIREEAEIVRDKMKALLLELKTSARAPASVDAKSNDAKSKQLLM